MATQPISPLIAASKGLEDGTRLSYDEGWDLIFSLFGSAGEMYAKRGGADAFLREERSSWIEHEPG